MRMLRVCLFSSCFIAGVLTLGFVPRASAQSEPAPDNSSATRRLTLQRAVDALVTRNLSVIAARYNVDLFRAQRVAAALKPDPTIVVSATQLTLPRVLTQPKYAAFAVADNSVLDTQFSVDVEKVVERGGKRELRVAEADLSAQVAEAQLSNELRQQTFELKEAFLSALLARENLRVFRDNLHDFDRMQHVFAAQVDEGYTAGVDLRRIGLELVELQGSMSAAQTGYVQGVRDVLNLIGEGESGSDDVSLELLIGDLTVDPLSVDIEAIRKLALANRADLRAAQLELDAANAAMQLAEANRTRDVTVGAQYLRSGPDNAVGVALGVPLTTARRAGAAVAQATALKLQTEARFRQVRAQVLTDVEKAFVAYRIGNDRLHLFDKQILRQASQVRDIEQVAYQEGERGLLSFLDAQRAYNQTLVSYNEARHAFALSVYQLEAATGTTAARLTGTPSAASGASDE
jgi:cobalt-zinc-cadmium efflux system outer membrane protein